MTRALRLRRETVSELTTGELAAVLGGVTLTGYYPTPTIDECPLTGPYPTLPVNDCLTNTIVTLEVSR